MLTLIKATTEIQKYTYDIAIIEIHDFQLSNQNRDENQNNK